MKVNDVDVKELNAQGKDEAQQMHSLYVAGCVHDLKNLLSIIANTVDVYWGASGSLRDVNAVKVVQQAINTATQISSDIVSSLKGNEESVVMRSFTPYELVEKNLFLLKGLVCNGIDLVVNIPKNLPKINADIFIFSKGLGNLVKNASEAISSPYGRIEILSYEYDLDSKFKEEACLTSDVEDTKGVIFEIRDTGDGMSPETLKKIFNVYFTTKETGTGLGLVNVLNMVKTFNGVLSVKSDVGVGTVFKIWFPISKEVENDVNDIETSTEDVSKENLAERIKPIAQKTFFDGKVLVVDDDPTILQSTSLLLRSLGCGVHTAKSTIELVNVLRNYRDEISIVFMDANVGSLNGKKLMCFLKRHLNNIPFVVVSGYPEEKIQTIFDEGSYDAFLGKPYTRADIKAIIDWYMNRV